MPAKVIHPSSDESHRETQSVFVTEGAQVERAFETAWHGLSLQKRRNLHWQKEHAGRFGMGLVSRSNVMVISWLKEARDRSHWRWIHDLPKHVDSRFLVFAEPDEQPQSIAEAMTALQVRSADRILFCTVQSQASLKSNLVRWLSAFAADGEDRIFSATLHDDVLVVRSPALDILRVSLADLQQVRDASVTAWKEFEVDDEGAFIYWPKLDVHMGWSQLKQLVDPIARVRAQQKSQAFNRRYGAAIRALREERELTQSQIAGLTDKTVRRIESGETRATSKAIAKLAAAHDLSPNAYMTEVAKRLKPDAKQKKSLAKAMTRRSRQH